MDLPRRYGHYVLLERVAVGGMGEIFRASYGGIEGFERLCAIKRILPHLADDEEFIDRLIAEAKIAVQLTHVNVVQVYELGRIDDDYFIAMEWVDGPDFSSLQTKAKAKDEPLPLALAIHVVHELARAVDYAHRKTDAQGRGLGIVHRDISPQNVLISTDGAVKLGDFGIARAGGIARRFATGMGAVLGKRRYMSPEQRRGEICDARTDIFALGAILHEAVTGEAPDPDAERPKLSSRVPDVPPELEDLVTRALMQDPDRRLANASELVEGLERVFMRLASVPGAIRDPALELGRFVRKVSPPGDKPAKGRSLTERMRAAMMPRAALDRATRDIPEPEGTMAVAAMPSAMIEESIAGEESETIVGSAMHPARALPAIETDRVTMPPVDADPRTKSTETTVAPIRGGPIPAGNEPLAAQTVITRSDLRRRAAVQVEPVTGTTGTTGSTGSTTGSRASDDLLPALKRPGRQGAVLAVFAVLVIAGAIALALRADPVPIIAATPMPTPTQTRTATAAPTVAVIATPAPTPTQTVEATPRRTATPRPTPTSTKVVLVRTPVPTPVVKEGWGTVSIGASNVPWASITIDGKKLDAPTPVFDLKLKSGVPHVIVLENPKLGRRKTTVTLRADEQRQILIDFKAAAPE